MKLISFRRQYLITSKAVCELNEWKTETFNGLNVYAEQSLQTEKRFANNDEFLMLGYWIDPHEPQKSNADIMDSLAKECDTFNKVLQFLYPLSGRFSLFCRFNDIMYAVSDAGGYRPIFYNIDDKNVNITSNIFLLKYVMDLKEKNEKHAFEHSDFYRWSSTYGWCPGYTFYENVESLIANHYLNITEASTHRFYPSKTLTMANSDSDLNKNIDDISILLNNSIASIISRGPVSFSLTSGYDSRMILSTAKEYADKMYFWISYFSKKQSDYFLPNKILEDAGLKRFPIKFSKKKYHKYRNFYFRNTPMAHDVWCKNHCSMIDSYPDNYTIIRGASSEVLKCEQFQDGIHPDNVDVSFVKELPNFYYLNEASQDVVNFMEDYLNKMQSACKACGYKTLDILQWEAGNSCGQWQMQSELESDFLCDVFVPLSNREIWDLFLSIPCEYRIRKNNIEVYQRIIKKNWPELLNYPFNPPSEYSKLDLMIQHYVEVIKYKLKKFFDI